MTRRAILGAGFTAVAGVVTLLTINRGSVFSRLQERLKTQRSKPNSKPGYLIMQAPARFVKRDGSNTVHYIDKLGRLLGVRSLDSVVWSDADIASLPKPLVARTIKVFDHNPKDRLAHINWSIFGRAIEEQALEALLNDNAPAAMRLLWLGVFHDLARPADTRQLRLYDLLAVLSFRNDRASLHRLLEFCERALADPLFRMRNRDLESRVTMWKSKTWQKKWNEDRVRRWHGVVV